MIIPSDYNFPANVHLYRFQDLNIVLDVNSGAIHVVDHLAAQFIQAFINCRGDFYQAMEACAAQYDWEKVTEVALEVTGLWEDGSLFSDPEDPLVDLSDAPVKALCLNVAHACNMKCHYCFAGQGSFGLNPSLMSREVGRKALDFLLEHSQGVRNLEVDFFGGEPLLNWEVVKDIVAYGRELEARTDKVFNFTLTTNCLLLEEDIMDYLVKENVGVILSLDGRQEVNDRYRVLNDGQGSYQTILPKIHRMIEKGPVSYYVRGTYTRNNLDFCADVGHIIEQGIDCLSLEPAVGAGSDFAIGEEDLPQVLNEYGKLALLLLEYHQQGRQIHFFHYDLDLQKGPCLAKRQTGCGAGSHYLAVTPEGDIYPCHQFVGHGEYCMGNVLENQELHQGIRHKFTSNTLLVKEECRQCWARNFCGGGCHANNYFTNGSISQPDKVACAMHRRRVEAAIYLELKKRLSE
ncbi:MAG: thioether cross-link-forming SCIFF peptide maturase [Syntrophomonadaceae bacterium]